MRHHISPLCFCSWLLPEAKLIIFTFFERLPCHSLKMFLVGEVRRLHPPWSELGNNQGVSCFFVAVAWIQIYALFNRVLPVSVGALTGPSVHLQANILKVLLVLFETVFHPIRRSH